MQSYTSSITRELNYLCNRIPAASSCLFIGAICCHSAILTISQEHVGAMFSASFELIFLKLKNLVWQNLETIFKWSVGNIQYPF